MIIGHGSIAKLLNDRSDFIFFASGIADSRFGCDSDRKLKRSREEHILLSAIWVANYSNSHLVYFGTISKFMGKTAYTEHKDMMEQMIKETSNNYTIINLGNVWECTNPRTFRNAMRAYVANGGTLDIHDEYKYMISKEQLCFITDNLPKTGKHEISIFGEMVKVKDALER
jgi:hypothetical protein